MVSPYLLPENREAYLRSKGLIEGDISDDDREWLYFINPHYLISYARNYQLLVEQNQITEPKTLSNIRGIVETDAQLAAVLMPWMRTAELNLRALTLKHYCAGHQFGDGYLDISRWTRMQEGDDKRLQGALLNSISRCGEPHVAEHLDRKWAKSHTGDRPKVYDNHEHELWLELCSGLPLWAVVDSFSMGTLGKFIMRCGVQSQENPLFKEIAGELGITAKYFGTAVESFGITRNLLFHHQRLWMRPMPKSPGLSKDLIRKYRNYDFKEKHKQAQFIALLTISRFLPRKQRDCYLDELENTIDQNEVFSLGIKKPPFPWIKKPANRRRSGKRGISGNS